MSASIRIGILGYGNLGRGVESALQQNPDMQLVGIFTRRDPAQLKPLFETTQVFAMDELMSFKDKIDVLILCGGSKDDLPVQGPEWAAHFNIVDSFDTHARIPEYFKQVDEVARPHQHAAVIAVGWDPGLFSLNRMIAEAVLPDGQTDTFWGKGLSQGHSDAVRRVPGVQAAVQYTIPAEDAMQRVRNGERPQLESREKHRRECYVVLEEGADAAEVEKTIVNMPHYFADFDTTVHFIDLETLEREHQAMPHGGFVIRSAQSERGSNQTYEFSLRLNSNPEFTSSVLVAYARAAYRLHANQQFGAFTIYDVAPALISPHSPEDLRARLL
ncbi:MAG TPA: diaminopimelate dehydrogenase [Paenalcaligenes sp.]|nr:diaminopimelate dehydrogenase [Paenalcaligenes sp.]